MAFTSFGESHGKAVGGVLEGVPAGMCIVWSQIREMLLRRSGVGQHGVSSRPGQEQDEVEWLSGVKEEAGELVALGTPIAFLIRNTNVRSGDYDFLLHSFRPGHADYTYQAKYGIREHRGGGRASARETVARVTAGGVAMQMLQKQGISIHAELVAVGDCREPERFDALLQSIQQSGNSVGGIVQCTITGVPAGVGEPIADKLSARLAAAMLSINGCHGFDYGYGFDDLPLTGKDLYMGADGHPVSPLSAQARTGGIAGGISDGTPIVFRCLFKPASTIGALYKGRHDACIAVRAVPVVEAMAALVLQDMLLVPTDSSVLA